MTFVINPYRFVSAAGGPLVEDSFTDTNSTLITAHDPDTDSVGGGWLNWGGTWEIQSNKLTQTSISASQYAVAIETNESDVVVSCDVATTGAAPSRVMVRGTDIDNCWCIELHELNNTFKIRERVAGSFTDRDTVSGLTVTSGVEYTIVVTANGSTISATLDGGNTVSYSSATFQQTATKHGLHKYAEQSNSFDNFSVEAV